MILLNYGADPFAEAKMTVSKKTPAGRTTSDEYLTPSELVKNYLEDGNSELKDKLIEELYLYGITFVVCPFSFY